MSLAACNFARRLPQKWEVPPSSLRRADSFLRSRQVERRRFHKPAIAGSIPASASISGRLQTVARKCALRKHRETHGHSGLNSFSPGILKFTTGHVLDGLDPATVELPKPSAFIVSAPGAQCPEGATLTTGAARRAVEADERKTPLNFCRAQVERPHLRSSGNPTDRLSHCATRRVAVVDRTAGRNHSNHAAFP